MTCLYIRNAAQLVTMQGNNTVARCGVSMGELGIIEGGSVIIKDQVIGFVGTDDEAVEYLAHLSDDVQVIDASDKLVTPGLIDPHTHLVFAGTREHELEKRLKGTSYMDILQGGGGILSTCEQTRAASKKDLYVQSEQRLHQFLLHGVTTIEAKSGYGLTIEDEIKQLEVAQELSQHHDVDIVSTFMGAHAIPPEYKNHPDEYVDLVIENMLPAVVEAGLADFCDVFCEKGVFTIKQSERILEAASMLGLQPKIHADELASFGGAELAARMGAVTADHLLKASDEGIKQLAAQGVIAVLLPGTAFFLMEKPAQARKMIDAGVAVALSTDRNPGSSPTESLPFMMNLACLTMKMTPEEVLTATTINAAHAIRKASSIGSLEVGKQADLVLFDVPNYQMLQYHYAVNHVDTVVKKGRLVVQSGRVIQ
ncbi:imidazolonepropionase [Alkalicoccobacillus murimartini]|uniref:Imidazolonepropionase n=1 Tax=Alkalicoccobacillus murimartini TaxID=171685 RepID=A0ABT9YJ94_9BACI|nr:imidazolonepropionase [Alkalicoccobacillus murimartini]MDQ0207673.1 imidazolonepropionase [Alkalicoccobacillus murimartini]